MMIYGQNFLLSFLKPMLILNSYEENKKDIKAAIMKNRGGKKVLELLRKGHQLKIQFGNYLGVELGIGRFNMFFIHCLLL